MSRPMLHSRPMKFSDPRPTAHADQESLRQQVPVAPVQGGVTATPMSSPVEPRWLGASDPDHPYNGAIQQNATGLVPADNQDNKGSY